MTDPGVPFRIPAYLQSGTDMADPAQVEWLAELPSQVARLADRWGLTLRDPFEPGGSCSWVAPGTDAAGREIVLKVSRVHTESQHEPDALTVLAGKAAVELYALEYLDSSGCGTATAAMLLERCTPGAELRAQPEHSSMPSLLACCSRSGRRN